MRSQLRWAGTVLLVLCLPWGGAWGQLDQATAKATGGVSSAVVHAGARGHPCPGQIDVSTSHAGWRVLGKVLMWRIHTSRTASAKHGYNHI